MILTLALIAAVLYFSRKAIARAAKRYIKRQQAKAKMFARAMARRAWTATKVQVARRTIGGLA